MFIHFIVQECCLSQTFLQSGSKKKHIRTRDVVIAFTEATLTIRFV